MYQSSKTVKTVKTVKKSNDSQNSKNDHWCTNRHMSTKTVPTVYQQCTNHQKQSKTVKTVKPAKMTIGVPIVSTKTVPTVYQRCTNRQKQSEDNQNSKNDHWCTNRHMSTKTVPTVCYTKRCTRVEQPSVLNKFFSELQYSAAFGRQSRNFAGRVWKYAKFRLFLAHPVV